METLTISGNTLTYKGNNYNIAGSEKTGGGRFLIYHDKGAFSFENGDTTINGSAVTDIYSHVARIPAVPKWNALYEALRSNTQILNKMRTATNMGGSLACVFSVIQRGIDGYPDEQGLQSLLNLGGWGFTNQEKTNINTYFSNNDFNIQI